MGTAGYLILGAVVVAGGIAAAWLFLRKKDESPYDAAPADRSARGYGAPAPRADGHAPYSSGGPGDGYAAGGALKSSADGSSPVDAEEVRVLLLALSETLRRAQAAGSRSGEVFLRAQRALAGPANHDDLERIKSMLLSEVGRMVEANAELQRELDDAHASVQTHRQTLAAWQQAARVDLVTQLPNAASLAERVAEATGRFYRYEEAFAVVLFVIDRYDLLLGQYGDEGADRLVRGVAAKLRGSLRTTDFIARDQTNRFVAIMPHIKEPDVEKQAERLRRLVEATRLNLDGRIVSIGLTTAWALPRAGDGPDATLRRAEAAFRPPPPVVDYPPPAAPNA